MGERRERLPDSPGAGPPAGRPDGSEEWLFGIRLLGGRYAFEASLVSEVVRLGPLTRLPAAPSFLPGVFNHRGEVLAVLDLGQLMGQAGVALRAGTRAAIVHCPPWKVAVVAEDVEGLLAVPGGRLEAPVAEAGGVSEFVSAVARDDEGPVAVLDLPRLVQAARARSVPS